jgi:AraC-like DNA-binding protein
MAVKTMFSELGYTVEETQLGWTRLSEEPAEVNYSQIRRSLNQIGFELMEDRQARLVEQIKTIVINRIHHEGLENYNGRITEEIGQKIHKDYEYLSRIFSEKEGITIERFIILQKIEKAKELMVYDELSLSQIALTLDYSSVSHISRQFKEVTGITPSYFKKQNRHRRSIDNINK